MVARKPDCHEEPSDVAAHRGSVVVDGPGTIAYAMTPDAAEATAARLVEKATEAKVQPDDD